jgi:hypothetical protein
VKGVAGLLNDLVASGVITDYALFGAAAQIRYTEAVVTMDADVLVGVSNPNVLDVLRPIYDFCASRGYRPEGEAVTVGEWPVQFIVTYNRLTEEALAKAETGDIEGIPMRVVGADYLAAIAIDTGRPKDFARVLALLECGATNTARIEEITGRHGLKEKWTRFRRRFLDAQG